MKKATIIVFCLTLFYCQKSGDLEIIQRLDPIKPSDLAKGVLYEVNIRINFLRMLQMGSYWALVILIIRPIW